MNDVVTLHCDSNKSHREYWLRLGKVRIKYDSALNLHNTCIGNRKIGGNNNSKSR